MLKLKNISKSFSKVKALENVSVEFRSGEIHALCGENGAGKSTLMNIISGNLEPDSGEIFWQNTAISIPSVQSSQELGIGIVYQERSLIDSLSVAENIFPVKQPKTLFGTINFNTLYVDTLSLLKKLSLHSISPRTLVGNLSPATGQMVEIAKALAANPRLLILDEPTASITHTETEILFSILRQLKEEGVAVIYISHRMDEIKEIANVVSVLKDGKFQGTVNPQTTTTGEIVRMMVGRELQTAAYVSNTKEDVSFEARNISGKGFKNISFKLFRGEILGFAGLLGSGRTEMATGIFGDGRITQGQILKDGKVLRIEHPAHAIKHGIAYIPEERKSLGLFLDKTVSENIISCMLSEGEYNEKKVDGRAEVLKSELGIKTPSVRGLVRKLSGGNQQKVVLAKWLNTQPDILIVNEPTHGVDVGAKVEIYTLLKKLTEEGKSVILISSDLPELLLLSDRVAVMYAGEVKSILTKNEATEERITALATGL